MNKNDLLGVKFMLNRFIFYFTKQAHLSEEKREAKTKIMASKVTEITSLPKGSESYESHS